MIKYDRRNTAALYYQVKEELKHLILSGELKNGDKICSESELMKKYEISRITAKRALDELVSEGYIYRVSGKGSFVSYSPIDQALSGFYSFTEEMKKKGMVASSKMLDFKRLRLSDFKRGGDICEKLLLEADDEVFYIKRLRLADGKIIAVDNSYVPYKLFDTLSEEDVDNSSLYNVIEVKFGYVPDKAREYISSMALPKRDAELFSLDTGTPVLRVERITFAREIPIEYNYRVYRGDKFVYSIELRQG